MSLNKLQCMAAAAVMSCSLAAHAADVITFDPTGTAGAGGNITNVGSFDWAPGSALSDNVNSSAGIVTGTSFTTYYQANLTAALSPTSSVLFANGGGGAYFTAVAGFGETVSGTLGTPATLAQFSFDSTNPVNFFKIYAVGATANDLTGAGFTGTAILTGHIVADGFSSSFGVSGAPSAGTVCGATTTYCLDQSPDGNDWPGTSTVTGSGGSKITIVVDTANADYFPDLSVGTAFSFSFFNTSQVLAYDQANPSQCLASATADCAISSDIGSINGAPIGFGGGSDVIFQADANQSFTRAAVPEPGSLALAGLALIGAVAVARRRRHAA